MATKPLPLIPDAPAFQAGAKLIAVQGGAEYKIPVAALPSAAALDVTLYGATGDGVTDDTAAINACFAVAQPGDTVVFPRGRYVLRNHVTIGVDRLTVRGEGAVIISDAAGQDRKFNCVGRTGLRFIGLRFDGGALTSEDVDPAPEFDTYTPRNRPGTIHFENATQCKVSDCHFKGLNWPVTILSACDSISISDSSFTGYFTAVYSYFSGTTGPSPRRVSIVNNDFYRGKYPTLPTVPPRESPRNYTFGDFNNSGAIKFRGSGDGMLDENHQWHSTFSHTIFGNRISEPGSMGIELQAITGAVVASNVITSCSFGVSLSYAQRIAVTGNTIKDCAYTHIEVDGRIDNFDTRESSGSISITGNTIDSRDVWGRPMEWVNVYGIVLGNISKNVTISGGQILFCRTAINCNDRCKNVTISGVFIKTGPGQSYGGMGGYIEGTTWANGIALVGSSNINISDCRMIPAEDVGWCPMVHIEDSDRVTITDCDITSNLHCVHVKGGEEISIRSNILRAGADLDNGQFGPSFVTVDSSFHQVKDLAIADNRLIGEMNFGIHLFSPAFSITNILIEGNDTTLALSNYVGLNFLHLNTFPPVGFPGGSIDRPLVRGNVGVIGATKYNTIFLSPVIANGTFNDSPRNEFLPIDYDCTINLHSAKIHPGLRKFLLIRTPYTTATLHPVSGEKINGSTSNFLFGAEWAAAWLVSDGDDWLISPAFAAKGLRSIGSALFSENFGTIAAGDENSIPVSVPCETGTASTPSVAISWNPPSGIVLTKARVTAANQVTITVRNVSSGSIATGAIAGRATVFEY